MQGKTCFIALLFSLAFSFPVQVPVLILKLGNHGNFKNTSELESRIRNPIGLQNKSESFRETLYQIFQNGLPIGSPMLESRYH
ncbi:hypothetical protein [Flavobacterium anhuiense]|uniref:hypothetical protein n=1 Tax=Flavobacterium anhuiense TaxID=459526 RepID=UPI0021B453AA|nr:hypothetical protein [Flavobacterium anhuiense]